MSATEIIGVKYLHGVFVEYANQGVLITGAPGVGKSTLGLELVTNGASLIADDLVRVIKINNIVYGQLPNNQYTGLLHLRQSGFVSVDHLHKRAASKRISKLTVIILLSTDWQVLENLTFSYQSILDVNIPFYSIHTSNTDAIYSIINSVAKMN